MVPRFADWLILRGSPPRKGKREPASQRKAPATLGERCVELSLALKRKYLLEIMARDPI